MSSSTDAVWDLLDRVPPASRLAEDGVERALGWDLWEAADLIGRGELSVDAFQDFRLWLVMLGREAFEAAVAEPDSLAGHPAVRALAAEAAAGPPGCFDLAGVAEEAFDQMTDGLDPDVADLIEFPEDFNEVARDVAELPAPPDFRAPEGLARRLPRLVELFGIPRSLQPR
jgi:hypothetical protein